MTFYLFGVTDDASPVEYGAIGFADPCGDRSLVKAIHYGGISMVACKLDDWRLNEANKPDLLNKLLEHQKITEKIMKKRFILPAKFGTTVDTEQDVISILSRYHSDLKDGIQEMKGFVEIDLVAMWDPIVEIKKMGETDSDIKTMKASIEKLPTDKRNEAVLKIGMLLQDKLEEKRQKIEKAITDALKSHFVRQACHERYEDRMVMNNSYLLKAGGEAAFFGALEHVDEKLGATVKFKCIHPLPPHSFATIVVNKVDPQELKKAMELFEVTSQTTALEIKDKSREFTKKFHPDKAGKESADKFETLNKSGKLLLNLFRTASLSEINVKRCYLLDFQRDGNHVR